jgi:hypothetical protein
MSLDELLFLTKDSCLEFARLGLAFVTEKVSLCRLSLRNE